MYAIIETGGKQYQVSEGDLVKVERLAGEAGEKVELNQVLACGGDDGFKCGQPYLDGVKVTASILDQGRDKKVLVGKYKAKKGYRRKIGHRQAYTLLKIDSIEG